MSARATVSGQRAFPTGRFVALAWLLLWAPAYAWHYGLANFISLCDVNVLLTLVGILLGSPLLLSSQAVGGLVSDSLWALDVAWRAATGAHLLGGTEYMWDPRWPAWLRALSLFHAAWPPLLLLAVRRVGYDGRGFALQVAIAAACIAGGRALGPAVNLNASWRDPVLHRAWGPAPAHLAAMVAGAVGLVYWPTHRLLARWMPPARRGA